MCRTRYALAKWVLGDFVSGVWLPLPKTMFIKISPSNSLVLLPSWHWPRNVRIQAEEDKEPAARPESQAPSIFPPAKLSPARMRGAGRSKESAGGPSGGWTGMA